MKDERAAFDRSNFASRETSWPCKMAVSGRPGRFSSGYFLATKALRFHSRRFLLTFSRSLPPLPPAFVGPDNLSICIRSIDSVSQYFKETEKI